MIREDVIDDFGLKPTFLGVRKYERHPIRSVPLHGGFNQAVLKRAVLLKQKVEHILCLVPRHGYIGPHVYVARLIRSVAAHDGRNLPFVLSRFAAPCRLDR
jgi:hypothetical protein